MIQDIYPHHYHNEYHPAPPVERDVIFGYSQGNIQMKDENTFYRYEDIPKDTRLTYLFSLDEHNCYIGDLTNLNPVEVPRTAMRSFEPRHFAFAAIAGWQLYGWLKENKYCGKCGHEMIQDGIERAQRCPSCDHIVYPKIMPAVIVAVLNKDKLLVTKYNSTHSKYNRYALVAGFNEIGETIEDTVIREVKEETGLDVDHLQYYKSQPWPFSSTLLFGFYCHVKGSDDIKIDENELQLAKWVTREEDIDSMDDSSLTTEMIQNFMKGNI